MFAAKKKMQTNKRSKSGKREDLGMFFRSAWEANYARYLNFLKERKEILDWEYEVDEFEFHGIKRGCRFYKTDFKILNLNKSIEYHEVKGWMDQKSKTKLNRMAKYYPNVKIVLIEKEEYNAIKKWSRLIPNWED